MICCGKPMILIWNEPFGQLWACLKCGRERVVKFGGR